MAISVRLPKQIDQRLNALAAKTGRTKAFYIREMILRHIDDSRTTIWRPRSLNGFAQEKSGPMIPRSFDAISVSIEPHLCAMPGALHHA